MYTHTNFKSKAALKRALVAGEEITFFQPGPFGSTHAPVLDGVVYLEGPHYPKPHSWYARATVKDGLIVKVA